MTLLVGYDVNTLTPAGRRRLRRVAIVCKDYGQRVQFSVFECTVSETGVERLRQRLLKEVDLKEDSLRIYYLGAKREEVVEAHGRDHYVDFTAPLVV
jgi:CRISPR-associated protein Cas2